MNCKSGIDNIYLFLDGHSGTFILLVTTRKKSKEKEVGIMNISFMKFTVLTPLKTFGGCFTTSIQSKKLCPIQITCFSRKESGQSGKTLIIKQEANGWSRSLSKKTWRKSAVRLG